MLTNQTQIEWALLEAEREPEFNRFCQEKIAELRAGGFALPPDLASCFAVQAAPGILLAKLLIEAFAAQASQPQWYRLRQLDRVRPQAVGTSA